MIKLKPFRQKAAHCGPASLKMVLAYYGIRKSEKELAKLCGTGKDGTKGRGILKAARHLGLKGFIKDYANVKDIERYVLKRGIPVIIDWFSVNDGHYSVVVDIDKENVYMQDPELGTMRAMRLHELREVWFDFRNEYPKSQKDFIVHRLIILYRPDEKK